MVRGERREAAEHCDLLGWVELKLKKTQKLLITKVISTEQVTSN